MKETLPYDFMAEDAVLGSIITKADVYDSVASYLSDEEVFLTSLSVALIIPEWLFFVLS